MIKIKDWLISTWYYIKLDIIGYGLIQYEFLKLQREDIFIDYIEKKARELADKEGVNIYFVSYDDMNKNETNDDEKAIGIFRYIKKGGIVQYEKALNGFKKLNPNQYLGFSYEYPRIEITEKASVFTILHELGHYFLYKKGETQSEDGANLYIEEFFNDYLPSFFKWIYQIDIQVRGGKEIKYSSLECYNYLKEYHKFKSDYGE